MKHRLPAALASVHFALCVFTLAASAQGTAFTYQGRLTDGANAVNGGFDLRFAVYDSAGGGALAGGPVTNAVAVSNGVFTTSLDFGSALFDGSARWLEIGVRTNGGASFTVLSPRQPVTATPYAVQSLNAASARVAASANAVSAANVTGTLALAQLPGAVVTNNNTGSVSLKGFFSGDGTNLTNVNAIALNGLNAAQFWQSGGNNVAPGQFLGSTNNQPVEIWVNAARALRLEPNASGAPNMMGGSPNNFVSGGVVGATIGGGGATSYYSTAYTNRVSGDFGTVGGGQGNSAGNQATVGGGNGNSASGATATVSGGFQNVASASLATVGGGQGNQASGIGAVIGGGGTDGGSYAGNRASGKASVVSGGNANWASGFYATVAGGGGNLASGQFSFAAGDFAQATNDGAFVWADSQGVAFSSTNNDSFNVRAQGGGRFLTSGAGLTVDGQPVLISSSSSGILIQQNASGAPNLIQGSARNFVSGGVVGATIAGGGATNYFSTPYSNSVTADFGTVGGGLGNSAGNQATVGGGQGNVASGLTAVVGGGFQNTASATLATVGGGQGNVASGIGAVIGGGGTDGASYGGNRASGKASVISGGNANWATGFYSSVAGGGGNQAGGQFSFAAGNSNKALGDNSTAAGGSGNVAGGLFSFAAGNSAQATNDGAFVWADSQTGAFGSTGNDQFLIRAQGGVGVNKNNPATALDVAGTVTAAAFSGSGANLASLNANNLASGTVPSARLSGTYSSALSFNNMGNSYTGSGASLTALNASNLASGTVALARLPGTVLTNNATNVVFNGVLSVANAGTSFTITPGYLFGSASNNCVTFDTPGFGQKIAIWDNLYVSDNVYANGVQLTSDRNAKEQFSPVDTRAVLEKVLALPVTRWHYKKVAAQQQHLGPVAQDFHAAFGLNGDDDTHIFASDESGVALAAIQGLNQKLEEKDAKIQALTQRLAALEALVRNQRRRAE